ncbi:hypothetical protein BGZ98_007177 [Dissophora globulifera]|nr:hypothetical protein BGZ98_007177 [Dissophora globulifera]
MAEFYQGFRSKNDTHDISPAVVSVVYIEAHVHPVSGERFIIWSDIAHCFPGVSRIQNGDIFVPLLRNERLYRVDTQQTLPPSNDKIGSNVVARSSDVAGHRNEAVDSPKAGLMQQVDKTLGPLFEYLTDSSFELQSIVERMGYRMADIGQTAAVATNNDNLSGNTETRPEQTDKLLVATTSLADENERVKEALRLMLDRSKAMLERSKAVEADWLLQHPRPVEETDNEQQKSSLVGDQAEILQQNQNQPQQSRVEAQAGQISSVSTDQDDSAISIKDISPATMTMGELRKLKETFKKASSQEIIRMMESDPPLIGERQEDVSLSRKTEEAVALTQDSAHQQPVSGSTSTTTTNTSDVGNTNVSSNPVNISSAIVKMEQLTAAAGAAAIAAASLGPAGKEQLQPANNAPKSPFSSLDIVQHRVKDILAKRYTWIESPCPKLFVILPTDPDAFPHQSWSDFDLHFLCDCSDITTQGNRFVANCSSIAGSEDSACHCAPHLLPNVRGFWQQKDLLKFGNYMLAILEMLEYGSRADGTGLVPLLKDLKDRKRVMYSMVFLMKQGIESSHQLLAKGYESLDDIKPVAPLTELELMDLCRTRINERRPFRHINVFQTLEGDVRWMCNEHCSKHEPIRNIDTGLLEIGKPWSFSQYTYEQNFGTIVTTLKTREQALEFYGMIRTRPTVPVISVFLDYALDAVDEHDLFEAVSKLQASCIRICVRDRPENKSPTVKGFGHGFYNVILAALGNQRIQAFTLERHVSDEIGNEGVDELFACKGAIYMDPVLARFTREPDPVNIKMGLLVTDMDKAAHELKLAMGGFTNMTKLTLETSYWEHIDIDFSVVDGDDKDDNSDSTAVSTSGLHEDVNKESVVDFFNRRKRDWISVRTYLSADTVFLTTHVLKDINIRIAYPQDGPRIRELIKNNPRLVKIELTIDSKDDPCQVFEYFKAIMSNHPTMDTFHLSKDWGKSSKSTFVWQGVSDRSKMSLSIMSCAEDNIGTLLQKFGACLSQIFLHGISPQDAIILEKVTRTRKSQLKLTALSLFDIFQQFSLGALEELTKVVLRTPLQRFQVTGTVNLKTASRVGDFVSTVASKITGIHFYGEHTKWILSELAKRMPESSNMELLKELKLSGPFDAATKDLTWIRSVLNKPIPLLTIELHKVNLSHQGWMTLAQEIDFKRLEYFRVGPDVPLKNEAVKAFVAAVPLNSELENYHLDSAGLSELSCKVHRATVLQHLRKKTALVSIGRYF